MEDIFPKPSLAQWLFLVWYFGGGHFLDPALGRYVPDADRFARCDDYGSHGDGCHAHGFGAELGAMVARLRHLVGSRARQRHHFQRVGILFRFCWQLSLRQ